jgi:23S rRNA pseudouridine2457 synthase
VLIRFNKPYGVLCQFRDHGRPTLARYIDVPDVYPAGRLDMDSEGLLLLTDDGRLQARISDPRHRLPKIYQVQVEAQPEARAFAACRAALRRGVLLRDGPARALDVQPIAEPELPSREPPVTPHRAARSRWVEITLTQGRNRQVRRMLAAVGWPVLRLVRVRIGPFDLAGLAPGEWAVTELPEEFTLPSPSPNYS